MDVTEIRIHPDQWPAALEDTDGHQIVVAGPGTGKTEFLIRRVAHLVSAQKAARHEIVVLAFSRRPAADIARRIETMLGAHGMPVHATTFHSLALRLLEAASKGANPEPLTAPEQLGLVRRVMAGENPDHWPLTFRSVLTTSAFAAEVGDFLLRCSERLLSPDDLEEMAQTRADWRGLPGLYRRYLAELARAGRTDYGTLLVSATELLASDEGQDLAGQFRYVLVDEYQDTSPAQAVMARLLARPHGNLTVSGDPYQSIYSFRGAEVGNVARFSQDHPAAKRIVLASSFRVPETILQSALRVVSSGELPGAAGPVEPAPHPGRVEAYIFDQETAEAEWIAREVEHAVAVDGITPSRIAVLARSKKELFNQLSRALARRNVPHEPPESRLVDHPAIRLIQDVVTAATADDASPVEAGAADRAMRRILLGPLYQLTLGQERDILRARRSSGASWADTISSRLPHHSDLARLVDDPSWATELPAAQGFWRFWTGLEAIAEMTSQLERADWRRAWTAFAQVLAHQAERDPAISLARYLALTEEEDYEATPLISPHAATSGVVVTTLHQAKGLEFDLVFIANAVEGVFPDLRRSRRILRPELLSPERTTDPAAQHLFALQEEMRLAYTAMTRARLRVVWTATGAGVDQGERRPSRFIIAAAGDEMTAPPVLDREPVTLPEMETALRRDLLDPSVAAVRRLAAARVLARPENGWWDPEGFAGVAAPGEDRPILEGGIRLSPSQADSYRRCPRRYALERRLRLADASSPHAMFGSLVHTALERAEREVIGTGEAHADGERALQVLKEVWAQADFGTPELTTAWLAKGEQTLTRLYQAWPTSDSIPVALEEKVTAIIGGTEWLGVIDRVEETPRGLRVIDYKTSSSPVAKAEAAESIQLAFYVLGLEERGHRVVEAQMWFPRHRSERVTTRSLDMDRLDQIAEQLEKVTTGILGEEWHPSPGDHCARCPFRLSCPAWGEGRGAYLP